MNKNTQKSNETKANLCEAFIKLYAERDIHKITVRSITELAGYNRGTFYLYYRDVYDIFEQIKKALIDHTVSTMKQYVRNGKIDSFENLLKGVLTIYQENQDALIPFVTKDTAFGESIKEAFLRVVALEIEHEQDLKLNYILEYHFSSVISVINLWVKNGNDISVQELINLMFDIATNGTLTILSEKGILAPLPETSA